MKTLNVGDIAEVFEYMELKTPVYVSCAFNHYQIARLIRFSDHVLIEVGEVDNIKNEGNYEA